MPYGLKPENVLCANTIALALAKRLVGSTKIMCSSESKSLPPNTIVDYYALLHLTVPFIPPTQSMHTTLEKSNF